jgi:hypothetical protein
LNQCVVLKLKGALLKYRFLCEANLDWQGDQNGEPIVILSKLPENEPKVLKRTEFTPAELKSFRTSMKNILSTFDLDEWESYLSTQSQEPVLPPFTLRNKRNPIQRETKLPISVLHPGYKPNYDHSKRIKVTYKKGI